MVAKVFAGRKVAVEARGLEDDADMFANLSGVCLDVLAEDGGGACGGFDECGQNMKKC